MGHHLGCERIQGPSPWRIEFSAIDSRAIGRHARGHPLEDPDVYELSWCIDVTEHPEATDPLQRYSAMGCFQTREPVVSA